MRIASSLAELSGETGERFSIFRFLINSFEEILNFGTCNPEKKYPSFCEEVNRLSSKLHEVTLFIKEKKQMAEASVQTNSLRPSSSSSSSSTLISEISIEEKRVLFESIIFAFRALITFIPNLLSCFTNPNENCAKIEQGIIPPVVTFSLLTLLNQIEESLKYYPLQLKKRFMGNIKTMKMVISQSTGDKVKAIEYSKQAIELFAENCNIMHFSPAFALLAPLFIVSFFLISEGYIDEAEKGIGILRSYSGSFKTANTTYTLLVKLKRNMESKLYSVEESCQTEASSAPKLTINDPDFPIFPIERSVGESSKPRNPNPPPPLFTPPQPNETNEEDLDFSSFFQELFSKPLDFEEDPRHAHNSSFLPLSDGDLKRKRDLTTFSDTPPEQFSEFNLGVDWDSFLGDLPHF